MNEEPQRRDPLRCFTFPGRLLFLATVFVGMGLFAWVVLYGKDHVPTGRYPVALILIPVVIGVAIFFVVVELVLRLFGIRVWSEAKGIDVQPDATPNGGLVAPSAKARGGEGAPPVS